MATPPLALDSLPVEIIRRIAMFASFESVYALLKVNHKLYKSCYDPIVFRAICKNRNGQIIKQFQWFVEIAGRPRRLPCKMRLAPS